MGRNYLSLPLMPDFGTTLLIYVLLPSVSCISQYNTLRYDMIQYIENDVWTIAKEQEW